MIAWLRMENIRKKIVFTQCDNLLRVWFIFLAKCFTHIFFCIYMWLKLKKKQQQHLRCFENSIRFSFRTFILELRIQYFRFWKLIFHIWIRSIATQEELESTIHFEMYSKSFECVTGFVYVCIYLLVWCVCVYIF